MSIGFKPNWNDLVHRHEYHFTDINLALVVLKLVQSSRERNVE